MCVRLSKEKREGEGEECVYVHAPVLKRKRGSEGVYMCVCERDGKIKMGHGERERERMREGPRE